MNGPVSLGDLLRPRPRSRGSEWAERNRYLQARGAARPGRFRCYPYQRAWIDDLCDPAGPRRIILRKSAQEAGGSEAVRCGMAYWLADDPGPIRVVLPDELTARSIMRERILPLLDSTPVLRRLRPDRKHNVKVTGFRLANDAELTVGWAGSPTRLAADPIRYAVGDEVDKWPLWSGRESSPFALLWARTKTYRPRDKQVMVSTPTTPDGPISEAWDRCPDRRLFYVPCPACDLRQPLEWDRVCWPGGGADSFPSDVEDRLALAAQLEGPGRAWVICARPGCAGRFTDEPQIKRATLDLGVWERESAGVDTAEWARSRAYQISDLYAPRTPFGVVAAAFLNAPTPADRMEFWNQTLGLPYAEEDAPLTPELFARRAVHPDGVVPAWATHVIATADTQGDHYRWRVRAWGRGSRSRGIARGRSESLGELVDVTLCRGWQREGGGTERAACMAADVRGDRTPDGALARRLYELAQRDRRVILLRGDPARDPLSSPPIQRKRVEYKPQTPGRTVARRFVEVHALNTLYWKDAVVGLIRDPELWEEEHGAADPQYGREMSAEHKVQETTARGTRWIWRLRSLGRANHEFDLAVYQAAAHEIMRSSERPIPTDEDLKPFWDQADTVAQGGYDAIGGVFTPGGEGYFF